MYCLDTINLVGNPVVNTFPELARIENSQDGVMAALGKYFGGGGMSSGIPSMSMSNLGSYSENSNNAAKTLNNSQSSAYTNVQPKISPYGQSTPYGGSTKPTASGGVKVSALLNQGSNPKLSYQESNSSQESADEELRRKIRELELENSKLKQGSVTANDKDWMNSGFGGAGSTG